MASILARTSVVRQPGMRVQLSHSFGASSSSHQASSSSSSSSSLIMMVGKRTSGGRLSIVSTPFRHHQQQQQQLRQNGKSSYRYKSSSSNNNNNNKTAKQRKSTLAPQEQHHVSMTTAAAATASKTGQAAAKRGEKTFLQEINSILNKPRTLPIPRWVSPTHSTTTLSEVFGHSSFILVAISYAVEDFLHLRLLAIAGSSVMLVFTYFHPHGRVLWLPFKWNVMFIAINTYRVLKVHVDRFFAEKLSPLMLHIHDHHFYVMDKVDFARLMRLGTMEHFKTGDVVVEQDLDHRHVRLVLKGELHVERDGQTTYMLHEGNFISESGLHAGLLLRGNINSCCSVLANSDDVVTVRWDRTELMQLLEIDKNIRNSLKAVMSWDIVSKLKSQRLLLARGKIHNAEEWSRKRREQTVHRYKAILANLLAHPQYLNQRKDELCKYREIHHIDDEEHGRILNGLGWSLEDFEKGSKDGQVDEDLVEMEHYGWKWYAQELKLRLLG